MALWMSDAVYCVSPTGDQQLKGGQSLAYSGLQHAMMTAMTAIRMREAREWLLSGAEAGRGRSFALLRPARHRGVVTLHDVMMP
jgi:hypothetical protein